MAEAVLNTHIWAMAAIHEDTASMDETMLTMGLAVRSAVEGVHHH